MKRVIPSLLVILTFICLLPRQPVEALTVTGLTVTLTCSGGHYGDFGYTFDRDNTGIGKEAFQIVVTDSGSNVVHLVSNSVTLGSYTETGADFTYNSGTAIPGAIVYQWVSQAGNGFDEQVAFSYTGFCGDAPTATPTPTPTLTPTPGPSPTPTPTITPTASIQDVYTVGGQDVLLVRQVTPGEAAIVGLLTLIAGLLMIQIARDFFKGGP